MHQRLMRDSFQLTTIILVAPATGIAANVFAESFATNATFWSGLWNMGCRKKPSSTLTISATRMGEKSCRAIVYERAERFCERCCSGGPVLTVHHRKNRSQGGGWTAGNCVLLCGSGVTGCHGWAGANSAAASAEGFHVKPWEDPLEVPVQWRMSRWAYLDDEGKVIDV
jgi:hypothetical protein